MRCSSLIVVALLLVGACEAPPPAVPATPPEVAPVAAAPDKAPAAPEAVLDLRRPPAVQTSMWTMAVKTNRISELLDKTTAMTPEERAEMKGLVDDVAKIAAGLEVDPSAQKHHRLKEGLPSFLDAVKLAQAGAAKEDDAPIRALGGQCRACHEQGKSAPPFRW